MPYNIVRKCGMGIIVFELNYTVVNERAGHELNQRSGQLSDY